MTRSAPLLCLCLLPLLAEPAHSQTPAMPMPIDFERSAELRWLGKPILDRRPLDDATDPATWALQGTGSLTFPTDRGPGGMPFLRVDVRMFHDEPAPTRNRLSAVTLERSFAGEDWSEYNRISLWIRPELSGFPVLPLQLVLTSDGERKIPDTAAREGTHYVTLEPGEWQQVVWEIEPLPRDRVTSLRIGYWVNKMLADPDDRVAFEIGTLELQRVEPDHYAGWDVAPGRIAFSHSGYPLSASKTAFASDLAADDFRVIRIDDNPLGEVVAMAPLRTVETRLGRYQLMDFSEVRQPGRYVLQAGATRTRPFRIDENPWRGTIWKTINFFFGERCGHPVPDSHGVCHQDWTATFGDQSIVMNGGWHDAGDLSQGMVNTGEATYAMFSLADRLQARDEEPELLERLLEEAVWGLDWVLRVRFPGGHRIGFAGNNLWTNGIRGDADDRSREALNSPNINYIAAAAGAIAARVLKDRDPELSARSLRIAEDDWRHAIAGTEGPETWSTPAYAASPLELAGIGALASLELYRATGNERYAAKAVELARDIVASQQKTHVGHDFPLTGFFYRGPDRRALFHQFHRGNDQAPIVALAGLAEAFPDHEDWMEWYSTVALYAEHLKTTAHTTQPYGVLPAYVYHEDDYIHPPEEATRHRASREGFREQVLQGTPMGDGYYLRAFPVWFARRGNYGVLLSQAKALSAAAHLRRDAAGAELAQLQAQWIVGRNPFAQSTMYGEGYDWAQQYSVSSGDIVGSLPVGMQSRGASDVPYWPTQNMYVYKEVWVHPAARWLWLMRDIAGPGLVEGRVGSETVGTVDLTDSTGRNVSIDVDPDGGFRAFLPEGEYAASVAGRSTRVTILPGGTHAVDLRPTEALDFSIGARTAPDGEVTLTLTASGDGTHMFTLRTHNVAVNRRSRTLTLRPGREVTVEWNGRVRSHDGPWVVVVVPDGGVGGRREVMGSVPARNE